MNGIPGKIFKCKRGVRQGDPLSPLLFVMATDLLQSIINKGYNMNLLKHPLSKDYGQDYPILQYVNDTLILLPADACQLFTLKGLLQSFSDSIGLKINFQKSFLIPINTGADKALHLANTIGCSVGSMPFTYLGLPLGTTWPSLEDFIPLINKIKRRMIGLNQLLGYHGRMLLVNLVLSALPTFYLCSLKILVNLLEQVDKYKMHCLWDKGDINRKGGCLVAWKKATRPKEHGGLGILDLRAQNTALLCKFHHKFYNKAPLP
jgi:hypothetical protein